MRWTKGKPPAKAPDGVPVLGCYDAGERRPQPRYVVAIMRLGWESYGDMRPHRVQHWADHWTGAMLYSPPDRWWPLPGTAAKPG